MRVSAGAGRGGLPEKAAAPQAAGGGMQALPVQTVTVAMAPVPQSSEYVATIKSRRSATLQPQVSGSLTADSRPLRRPREGRPGADGDRSAAAAGHGRLAARHRAAEEGALRLTTLSSWTASTSCLTPALPAATPSSRRSRPLRTPRRTTSRPWNRARRRSSCWPTTPSARRSTAWWATFRCTWATTFRRRPC